MSSTKTLASVLLGAVTAAAHGQVSNIVINGVSYQGYDVTKFPYQANPPTVVGWANSAKDLGFVDPPSYASPDIICHKTAENAGGHAAVSAGDHIFLQWDRWPEGHKGPVLDYLASCGDSGCESVDKTALEFFKISEKGLIDSSSSPGYYASDELIDNDLGWMVKIPADLAPGDYVLRHEIIALHSANQANGAQNYPQCFNLRITGSGTRKPAGVPATELYGASDPGIAFNLYNRPDSYVIPGPALIEGASAVEQSTSAVSETGSPTTDGGAPPAATATQPEVTTTAEAEAGTTSVAPDVTATPEPEITTIVTSLSSETVVPSATSTSADLPEETAPACAARKNRNRKRSKRNGKKSRRNVV